MEITELFFEPYMMLSLFSALLLITILILFIVYILNKSNKNNKVNISKEAFLIEDQFINAFGTITEGIIVFSREGIVRYLNKTAETLLHIQAKEYVGKNVELQFSNPAEPKTVYTFEGIIERIEQCNEQHAGYTCSFTGPEQTAHDVSVTVVPLKNLDNKLSGIALVVHEVLSKEKRDQDPAQLLQQHLKSLEQIEQVFGERHNTTAIFYNNTAYLYFLQKKYDKAISLYKKAIAIREDLFGLDHVSIAPAYDDLARVYHAKGDHSTALQYLQRSIRIKKNNLGNDHSDTAYTYHVIGRVYQSEHKFDQALRYYNEALHIRQKVLGEENLDTASSYNNIGGLFISQNKYEDAIQFFLKALETRKKLLGDKHVKIGQVYLSLGIAYFNMQNLVEAEKCFLEAKDNFHTFHGTQHPLTKDIYHWIAHLYEAKGMKKEAGSYRDRTEYFKSGML